MVASAPNTSSSIGVKDEEITDVLYYTSKIVERPNTDETEPHDARLRGDEKALSEKEEEEVEAEGGLEDGLEDGPEDDDNENF